MNEENTSEEYRSLPYMDGSKDLEERVEDLLNRLTFREKCMLCAGEGNNSPPPIPRLGIPAFGMTDGPHGVSPYKTGVGPNGVKIPEESAGTSTYFPTGTQLASTWNPELMEKFGSALAEETRAVGRYMQLGPAMNICRQPMNGRTFEYYSEDPLLSGKMGAAAVRGMQKIRVSPCVKHYVANNFETNRFKVNAVVDKRTLEEIYLKGFKILVKESDPWGMMSAYNKINGVYVSEDKLILREILKDDWGFSGVVVSDWGATNHTSGIKALVEAGLDIEMGSRTKYVIDEMIAMKDAGEFPEEAFDDNIRRFLRTMFRVGIFDDPKTVPEGKINTKEHQAIARELAEEGMVLLKNEGDLLPLDAGKVKKIAILGKHADLKFGRKRLGGGSSAVFPPYEVTVREGLMRKCKGKIEIVEDPADADVAIVCVGLEHSHDFKGGDHEGTDRLNYSLGVKQPKLIVSTAKKNPNTIVVCINGSPFKMEKFIGKVPAILEAWYGGMEVGTVVADILFGDVNPSGKLPISWPKCKKDMPASFNVAQKLIQPLVKEVVYTEGVFIGYRHYDTNEIEPLFPFGHGLSYTSFKYSDLELSKESISGDEDVIVSFKVSNTGDRDGAETVQLYVRDVESSVKRPVKELKGFKKIMLEKGASLTVKLTITKEDLSFFDMENDAWVAEPGDFEILVGSSSRDIRLKTSFQYS
ncbi:MAG: glycoside hydrolase family 3 C-terminal domain-containing protein [Promethearchaeota archaeon]